MKWTKWIAMSVAVMLFSGARAEEPSAASVASQEWRSYVSPLEPIGERLAGQLSDQNDAQLRQDMYRRAFSALSAAYMSLFVGDGEHPDFWPIFNQAYNFWAPNPDNVYYGSTISADGVYKISGFRGTRLIVDFQTAGGAIIPNGTGELGRTFANYDIDYDVHVNKDGSFEVILSPERPAGHKGDWWKLDPNTTYILVRQISYDWLRETDGRFAIERLDRPAIKPRLTAEQSDAKLRLMAEFAENWTASTARWVDRQYRSKGTINKITVQDMSSGGGLSPQKQLYIGGMFDLKADEALVYETTVPKKCRYWNIQLTDELWGPIDVTNRQTSINGYTAKLDKDGKFRAVISATDPGVPNWLDTGGYARGVVFGRWNGCSSNPQPEVQKVKVADVRQYIPADTPLVSADARDTSIRERRKGIQLRRRW